MKKKKETNIDIPTSWLRFCIYWRIPAGIFIGIGNIGNTYTNIEYWTPLITLFFAIDIATIIVYILTFIFAKGFTKKGFYFLYVSLIIESILLSMTMTNNALENSYENYFSTLLIFLAVVFLIWFLPNHIYLKKRKHLFIDDEKEVFKEDDVEVDYEEPKTSKEKNVIPEKIEKKNVVVKSIYCKKCGGKLDTNNKCGKCGKQYFKLSKKIIPYIVIIGLVISNIVFILLYNDTKNTIENIADTFTDSTDWCETQMNMIKGDKTIFYIQDKLDFFDDNIVFVIEGYGDYYYSYDCVQKITNGEEYSFWAYNVEAAKHNGYKKGSCR